MNRTLAVFVFAWLGCRAHGELAGAATATTMIDTKGRFAGAGAAVNAGTDGLRVGLGLGAREVDRVGDPDRRTAAEMTFQLALSPLGMIADDHRLERYFDFGVDVGLGAGVGARPGGVFSFDDTWAGGWLELGTISLRSDSYLVITLAIRAVSFGTEIVDDVVVMPGIGIASRGVSQGHD